MHPIDGEDEALTTTGELYCGHLTVSQANKLFAPCPPRLTALSLSTFSRNASACVQIGTEQSYPVHPVSCGSPLGLRNRGKPPPSRPSTHVDSHYLHLQTSGATHSPPLLHSWAQSGMEHPSPLHPLAHIQIPGRVHDPPL